MLLKDLIADLRLRDIFGNSDVEIKGIAYDSRRVSKGDIFVCIKGFKTDGHNYLEQALKNGAVAVIAEKKLDIYVPVIVVDDSRKALAHCSSVFYNKPSSKFKLIGVTGTNGKTTTTYLVKSILESKGAKVGLIGTNQNMIGEQILKSERTTPESLELQQLFDYMASKNVEYVVMEVSSHSLELDRVYGCEFDIGVFTNLTREHLDFHQTMNKYLKAKAKLFKMCEIGVINIDDEGGKEIYSNAKCVKIGYGIDSISDIMAKNIVVNEKGVDFNIVTAEGVDEHIELGIPGKFTVYNALGSIGACMKLGVDIKTIKKGLKQIKGVAGRIQHIETGRDFSVIIDYAHTPDGLKNILSTVKDFTKGRLITVFGCGGDRDKTKRPIMGEIAGGLSDFCIITSDNPRTEDPFKIIIEIEEGIKNTECEYKVIENREKAIEYALNIAKKDDIVILAGKGHETYQILKDSVVPFDEYEIVRAKLNI